MGGKESKPNFITYEDAVKRVSTLELKRIRETFRRTSSTNGYMDPKIFRQEVLWEGVSSKMSKLIYYGFGGTPKGLLFRDLLCGLVVLTRGSQEEKIRFLYGIYANDEYTCVLKHEIDQRIQESEGTVSPAVGILFREADDASYDTFKQWLQKNPTATLLSKWLLTHPDLLTLTDHNLTPTFYQTLSGVTHLEERDITGLEKRYWLLKAHSKSGQFDNETFSQIISPPLPSSIVQGLFEAFDENNDNHIDFKEMACGVSACCKGPVTEQQKFCFKVFDKDKDERLNHTELCDMITALLLITSSTSTLPNMDREMYSQLSPESVVAELLQSYSSDNEVLTQAEYLMWTVNNSITEQFTMLLSQICHIILGLRPKTGEAEGKIVNAWLESEWKKPLKCGQTWYLVSYEWWKSWKDYVSFNTFGKRIIPEMTVSNGHANSAIPHRDPFSITTSRTAIPPMYTARHSTASPNPSPIHKIRPPPLPSTIDNNTLIEPPSQKYTSITNEGGKLRSDISLVRGKNYEILPLEVWQALCSWYGSSLSLPRNVIKIRGSDGCELELYPVWVRLLKHQSHNNRHKQQNGLSTMFSALTTFSFSSVRRPQIGTATFSRQHTMQQVYIFLCTWLKYHRDDVRLWKFKDETNMTLLDDDATTIEEANFEDNQQLLIEIRNKDLTWPEELCQLAKSKGIIRKELFPLTMGVTGLNNLGNTCFMNAALQCVSNISPLTYYFKSGMYLYEINRTSKLGMQGNIALRYGDLIRDLWSGTSRTIAPLRLRWTIGKYAPRFNSFSQHDSQEFLSFLIDGLHEDLNRVHNKPYVELKDSEGRADEEVAEEARENHHLRNQSIIVDLFHGLLKSEVECKTCSHPSTRFDPFTCLSLPLPMDNCLHTEVIVARCDGSVPISYGIHITTESTYEELKSKVSEITGIASSSLLFVDVHGPVIKSLPQSNEKVLSTSTLCLYVYELHGRDDTLACNVPCNANIQSFHPTQNLPMEKGENHADVLKHNRSLQSKNSQMTNHDPQLINHSLSARCVNSGSGLPDTSATIADSECNRLFGKLTISQNEVTIKVNNLVTQENLPTLVSTEEPISEDRNSDDTNIGVEEAIELSDVSFEVSESNTDNFHQSSNPTDHRESDNIMVVSLNDIPPLRIAASALSSTPSAKAFEKQINGFVIAVHRKMVPTELYFFATQKSRPNLFGVPLIVPCSIATTNRDLYKFIWVQVSRLVSPSPRSESRTSNHAQDCDDSLAYEYPFLLKLVQLDGLSCVACPFYCFCRGCKLDCNDDLFNHKSKVIAIDWEATALHLRYQTSAQQQCHLDPSVKETRSQQTDPIDLDSCLKAFTTPEELDKDEQYYCSKCKKHRIASKKLNIWSLPPILIINLKRFQYKNGRWVKSHKAIKFPFNNFDPSKYLSKQPARVRDINSNDGEQTCHEIFETGKSQDPIVSSDTTNDMKQTLTSMCQSTVGISSHSDACNDHTTSDTYCGGVTSVTNMPGSSNVTSDHLNKLPNNVPVPHEITNCHPVINEAATPPTSSSQRCTYSLCALACHIGILGGGHYIAYAKNPNGRWYLFNDSMCKEVEVNSIDTSQAYILFYMRDNTDFSQFYPQLAGKTKHTEEPNDEYEIELKKCVIQ